MENIKLDTGSSLIDMLENSGKQKDDIDFREFRDIKLSEIKPNPKNNYPIEQISEMARSIKNIGLRQPIEVRVLKDEELNNEDKEKGYYYLLLVGERRFRATEYLLEKATIENNHKDIKKYSTIKGRVISTSDEKNEDIILTDTNDTVRILTPIKKIILMNPKKSKEYFSNTIRKKDYIERKFGEGSWNKYLDNEIEVKFNESDVIDDIVLRFRNTEKNTLTDKSIQNYVLKIKKLSDEMTNAILKSGVDFDNACLNLVSDLTISQQDVIANKLLKGKSFEEAINGIVSKAQKEKAGVKKRIKKNTENEISDRKLIINARKTLTKFYEDNNEIINGIDSISKDCTLNGNQKENLKQIKSILKSISELMKMDK